MSDLMQSSPVLVAHRGYSESYPENSLDSITAALKCGAKAVEFDIQLTADRVPVLFHDDDLQRVTGQAGTITALTLRDALQLPAGEPARFGDRFNATRISTLAEIVPLLARYSQVEIFVELKKESLDHFSTDDVVDTVASVLKPIQKQCILISFEESALYYAQSTTDMQTGWVLTRYDDESKTNAQQMRPDFIICNYKKIPDQNGTLWPRCGQWMLYETADPAVALKWHKRGAQYFETNCIGEMLEKIKT